MFRDRTRNLRRPLVLSVVALGQGSQQAVLERISSIGTNTINVLPGASAADRRRDAIRTLVPADAAAIAAESYADSVTPQVSSNGTVRYRSVSATAQIQGVGSDYFRVNNRNFVDGTTFDAGSITLLAQEAVIDTTARDVAILGQALIRDFPESYAVHSQKELTLNGITQHNRNSLLWRDPTVDGIKTGHTRAAGYCLVATSKREFPGVGQRRLLSIVLGAASENARANESQKLLNWGYTAFEAVKLFEAGKPVATPAVWKGTESTLKIGRDEAIVVAVPSGSAGKITTQINRPDPLVAPFTKGQSVGSLKVVLGEQTLADVPLVALEGVEQAGILGRAWDAIRLWIK